MKCQKCGKREATIKWVGEGDSLSFVHGFYQEWCEVCCLKEQIAYAERLALKIPELKKKLRTL